jgi:hypothetical protein
MSRGICWGTEIDPTTSNSCVRLGSEDGEFSYNITGLTYSTTYYLRAYATNSVGISYGESRSFTTLPPDLPELTTGNVYSIGETSAWCSGSIIDNGGAPITDRGLIWTSDPDFDLNDLLSLSKVSDSRVGTGSYGCKMTGLTPYTTYYVRAYATNSAGTNYGNIVTYTTISKPLVLTSPVSDITNISAKGTGTILNDGGTPVTQSGLCWSTSENPTVEDSHTTNGGGIGSFSYELKGLLGNTTYYVRAYAMNKVGISYGDQEIFVTSPPELATLITMLSDDDYASGTAVCGGSITSNGGALISRAGVCCSTKSGFDPKTETEIETTTTEITKSGDVDIFTTSMIGLNGGTTYYIRSYAENSVGKSYGNEIRFIMPDLAKVNTTTVYRETKTTVVVGGKVTEDGGKTVTERGFVWSINPDFDPSRVPVSNRVVSPSSGPGSFEIELTGLKSNTSYYVRAYAINSLGIIRLLTEGAEITTLSLIQRIE